MVQPHSRFWCCLESVSLNVSILMVYHNKIIAISYHRITIYNINKTIFRNRMKEFGIQFQLGWINTNLMLLYFLHLPNFAKSYFSNLFLSFIFKMRGFQNELKFISVCLWLEEELQQDQTIFRRPSRGVVQKRGGYNHQGASLLRSFHPTRRFRAAGRCGGQSLLMLSNGMGEQPTRSQ